MEHTKEKRRSQYTSPTAAAPILVGYDGSEGGRDALALAPGPGPTAEEAREALGDSEAPVEHIGITSSGRVLASVGEQLLRHAHSREV